jgi:hypothetical protein
MSSKKMDGKLSCGTPVDKNNVNSIEPELIIERQFQDGLRSPIQFNIYCPSGTDKENVPLVNKELNIKFCLLYTFGLCTTSMSASEYQKFKDAFRLGVESFVTTGCITEAQMDAWNLKAIVTRNKKPKDQRALHQQRAVIMNSVDCIAKYIDFRAAREAAPVLRAQQRERS